MFGKKKQMEAAPVSAGATGVAEVKPPAKKVEVHKAEKLPGPSPIPEIVVKHLVAQYKMGPILARILKAVVHHSSTKEDVFDIRIFDESEAMARQIHIKDYTSFEGHPDLIIYEGWFDERAKRVELQEKKKVSSETTIFSEAEIKQRIETLSEPGSSVFFYMARGSAHGGPLGVGAAVVELNPDYPKKIGKKYNIRTTNVIDMQPVGKGQKLFESDKPKDIARWMKESHQKRMY